MDGTMDSALPLVPVSPKLVPLPGPQAGLFNAAAAAVAACTVYHVGGSKASAA